MLDSATNFAFGFFGWPLNGKVLLEVTVEAGGVRFFPRPYFPGNPSPFIIFMTSLFFYFLFSLLPFLWMTY